MFSAIRDTLCSCAVKNHAAYLLTHALLIQRNKTVIRDHVTHSIAPGAPSDPVTDGQAKFTWTSLVSPGYHSVAETRRFNSDWDRRRSSVDGGRARFTKRTSAVAVAPAPCTGLDTSGAAQSRRVCGEICSARRTLNETTRSTE